MRQTGPKKEKTERYQCEAALGNAGRQINFPNVRKTTDIRKSSLACMQYTAAGVKYNPYRETSYKVVVGCAESPADEQNDEYDADQPILKTDDVLWLDITPKPAVWGYRCDIEEDAKPRLHFIPIAASGTRCIRRLRPH